MPNYTKTCPECGNTFIGPRHKAVCSDSCRQAKSRRPRQHEALLERTLSDLYQLSQMADDHPYLRRGVIESLEKIIEYSVAQIREQCSKRDATEGTVQRGAEGVTLKRDTTEGTLQNTAEGVTLKRDMPACHTSTDLT